MIYYLCQKLNNHNCKIKKYIMNSKSSKGRYLDYAQKMLIKKIFIDLINEKKYPLDITMKMCKVPRKSLRRWSHVGCLRKKGCGRKTKNPQMEEKLLKMQEFSDNLEENFIEIKDKKLGIVTDSVSYMYVKEVYPNASVLKLSMPFPFPDKKIKELTQSPAKLY